MESKNASLALIGLWTALTAAGVAFYFWVPEDLPHWGLAGMAASLWLAGLVAFGLVGRKLNRAWREPPDSKERSRDEFSPLELPMAESEAPAGRPGLIAMDDLLRLEQAMVERTADLQSQQRQVQSFLNSLKPAPI